MSKRPKWNSLTTFGSAEQPFEVGGAPLAGGDLHHLGVAVAARELHHAKPVAADRQAKRFGVDRDGFAESPVGGQVGAVEADGHGGARLQVITKD